MFSISVNDLVEELYEENNRLLNELFLTQKCFQLLSETKDYIELNFSKYGNNCDSNDSLKYHEIINNINDVIERRNVMIKKEVEEYNDNDMNEEVVEESEEQFSDTFGDYNGIEMCDNSDYNCSSDEKNKQNKPLSQQNITSIHSVNSSTAVKMTTVGHKTRDKDLRRKHIKAHKVLKHWCDWPDCGQGYTKKCYLIQHIDGIHKKLQPYTCSHLSCDFRTAYKKNLKVHEERHLPIELRDRPLKCDWPECDYSTKTKYSLNQHIRSHNNERPFACLWPRCDFRAVTKETLKSHIEIHSTELNHVCDCGKRFKTKSSLRQHIYLVHKGWRRKKKVITE